jgi:three-Cys-motif partner protein
MKIAKSCVTRSPDWACQTLQYIDATAGRGREDTYGDGSALIFLDIAKQLDLTYQAHFIERDLPTYNQLLWNIPIEDHHTIWNGAYSDILPHLSIPSKSYGLLYVDPNGTSDEQLNLESLGAFARKHPYIDILLRLSANNMKRDQYSNKRICEVADAIGKFNWSITEPAPNDKNQWMFLLGTGSHSPLGEYNKIGLHPIHEEHAQQVLFSCNFSTKERKTINQLAHIDPFYTLVIKKPITRMEHKSFLSAFKETRVRITT